MHPWSAVQAAILHACHGLGSSGIIVGPSRLNGPIGWLRKAGSTSSAVALYHFSILRCPLADGTHFQASHSGPALKMRYNAVLIDWSCRHAVPVENQLLHTRSRSRLVHPGDNWLAGSLARFHASNAHLLLAAEHAAGNRCANRKHTEQIGCRV